MPIDAQRLLLEHLDTVERVAAFICRRNGIDGADAEDFSSSVKLRLLENDCAILRKFEGRSSISSYLTIVVQRMLFDDRVRRWGKWHASAEAKRLGDLAIELEKMVMRDGRSVEEVLPLLAARHDGVTRESLRKLVSRFPMRTPHRREVDLEEAESIAVTSDGEGLLASERAEASERISKTMRSILAGLSSDDQLILQLRFESGMTVADIARSLRLDQKLLYRRLERLMREIRDRLGEAGVDPEETLDLLDHPFGLDFDIGIAAHRPSPASDGGVETGQEEIPR